MKIKKQPTNQQLAERTEALAREWVDRWIADGCLTGEMQEKRRTLEEHFGAFMFRDIRLFAETGKYPKWAEIERAKGESEMVQS